MTIEPLDGIGNVTYSTATDKELILTGQGISEGVLPQTADLIRYHHFSAGSGTTVEDATGNADGTLRGSTTWETGYDGFNAVASPGSDSDYVGFQSPPKFSAYSIFTLTEHDSPNSGNLQADGEYGDNNALILRGDGNGNMELWHNDGSNWTTLTAGGMDTNFHLWTFRWDGSTVYLTRDGDTANQKTGSASAIGDRGYSGSELGLLASSEYGYGTDGRISLHLAYDAFLSDSEVSQVATDLGF